MRQQGGLEPSGKVLIEELRCEQGGEWDLDQQR